MVIEPPYGEILPIPLHIINITVSTSPHHIVMTIIFFHPLIVRRAGGDGGHASHASLHSGGLAQGQRVVA